MSMALGAAAEPLALRLETPENAVLAWPLAGPTVRGLAYLMDFAIRWAVFVVVLVFVSLASIALPGLSLGMMFLVLFLLEWIYFIAFEYFWQGRTPGKALCGLRAMMENGQPITWWASTTRNLLRAADTLPLMIVFGDPIGGLAMLPIYGPALVSMALTRNCQRLGDLAARTVVIEERRWKMPSQIAIFKHIEPLPRETLSSYVPSRRTLGIIDRFLARRTVLTHQRGHAIAADFAAVLARKLGVPASDPLLRDYPMAWLGRVYVTFNPRVELAVEANRTETDAAEPVRVEL